jgi:hypothetical protein
MKWSKSINYELCDARFQENADMSKPISTGERRLMAAMLLQSIEDIQQPKRKSDQYKAKTWFNSKDTKYLYSFENVCIHLERDSNTIRKKLNLYVKRK